jgi:hypothetical protein
MYCQARVVFLVFTDYMYTYVHTQGRVGASDHGISMQLDKATLITDNGDRVVLTALKAPGKTMHRNP